MSYKIQINSQTHLLGKKQSQNTSLQWQSHLHVFEFFCPEEKKNKFLPELQLLKNHFNEKGQQDKADQTEKNLWQILQLKHHSWHAFWVYKIQKNY